MYERPFPAARRIAAPGLLTILLTLGACGGSEPDPAQGPDAAPVACSNPLDARCAVPGSVPPFDKIEPEHFVPAMRTAIDRATRRIRAISGNPAPPEFANTITALEDAGAEVTRIARIWYGLAAVDAAPGRQPVTEAFSRLLSEHERRILHDRSLYRRVDRLHDTLPASGSTPGERRLIEETWRRFRRAGAHLADDGREELAEIDRRISALDREYERARQAATHRHELLIDDPERLVRLPPALVELARQTARDRGRDTGWVFTLHAHSFYPFMRHFPGRAQRRELYRAWMTRYRDALKSDENLGRLIERLARLRARRAALLGFDSHIDFLLDDASLSSRETLENLLERLSSAAAARAARERAKLSVLAADDGIEGELQPWDWWYYRQRLLETESGESRVTEWLALDQVTEAMFSLAARLWGLEFRRRYDLPAWHADVSAFSVFDDAGKTLGTLYLDPLHRRGKRGGAWTSQYRVQRQIEGRRVAPVVAVVANLSPSAGPSPTLLSPDQVRTLFHEFGHALHALFSDVRHAALAGTNVPPDFVEFPALLFERWSLQPAVLAGHARHYRSGAPLDPRIAEGLQRLTRLTSGLETLELLASIELDLALHGARPGEVPDLETAERGVREKLGLPAMISPRHHGGGLSSVFARRRHGGDFRTLWSELLASDTFAAFESEGLLDRELGRRLREQILSRGNARPPMASWQAFRGRAPDARHLLEARGLASAALELSGVSQDGAKMPSGE